MRCAIIVLAAALVLGCAATPAGRSASNDAPRVTSGESLAARPYTLGLGDRLRLDAPTVPELHEHEATVRDTGYVTLPLLGDVFAAGRTPAQLGSELHEKLRRFYLAPTVRVSVFLHQSRQWYAEAGDVRVTRPYTGGDQPGDALSVMRVRGLAQVRVYRPDESGRLRPIDLGSEPLEAGDVVRIGGGSLTGDRAQPSVAKAGE